MLMSMDRDKLLKYIGRRFSIYRFTQRLSREEAARALNISERTLASYERGEREISLNMAIKMAELYKTTFKKLVDYYNVLDELKLEMAELDAAEPDMRRKSKV